MRRALLFSLLVHGTLIYATFAYLVPNGFFKLQRGEGDPKVIYVTPVSAVPVAQKKVGNVHLPAKKVAQTTKRSHQTSRSQQRPGRGFSLGDLLTLGNDPPLYPDEALEAGWEGQVKLGLEFSSEGEVAKVGILNSSGHPVLDQAAVRAAWLWKVPKTMTGDSVESLDLVIPIEFQIVN